MPELSGAYTIQTGPRRSLPYQGRVYDAMVSSHRATDSRVVESLLNMTNMCILVANEPRAYREVMAAAFHELRPQHDVITVAPDDLGAEVVRLDPQLVLCSQLTPAVQTHTLASVMLYPDGETRAEICIGGQFSTVADLEFNSLLALIDQTEGLAQRQEAESLV